MCLLTEVQKVDEHTAEEVVSTGSDEVGNILGSEILEKPGMLNFPTNKLYNIV